MKTLTVMARKARVMKLLAIVVLGAIALMLFTRTRQGGQEKMSEFGKYAGYSTQAYNGHKRISDYLTMADGTRLAYDLFLPSKKGVLEDVPMPALFKYTPYSRAWTVFDKSGANNLAQIMDMPWYMNLAAKFRRAVVPNGNVMDAMFKTKWLSNMVTSGYAVIVVDRPGTGASFGTLSSNPEVIARELDEILNWIAAQKWCDGNIGMFGDSIQAQVQFHAASTGNPHLKAILPATTWMDNYSAVLYPGGVRNKVFGNLYSRLQNAFNSGIVTPVDRDGDGALLAQARAERGDEVTLAKAVELSQRGGFRDSSSSTGLKYWIDYHSLYPLMDRINQHGVPVYLINGWYDLYSRDNFLIYANLTGPKRLMVRPVDHSGIEAPGKDTDFGAEAHRWFDYWLKGIDNGIMGEPPVHYYLQNTDKQAAWHAADTWPLRDQTVTRYYFAHDEKKEGLSVNDGALNTTVPAGMNGFDEYKVDYTTTTGSKPHWVGLAEPHKYPNMRERDARALTYTTPALKAPVDVTGHPVIRVWLSTSAPDLDVFAYLEKIDGSGNATYISQGNLRASHRALNKAPFDNFGLPWHDHFQGQTQELAAGVPAELVFALLPTAYRFQQGDRIRVTIAFADDGNFDTPVLTPAPVVRLLRDGGHLSYLEMPVR